MVSAIQKASVLVYSPRPLGPSGLDWHEEVPDAHLHGNIMRGKHKRIPDKIFFESITKNFLVLNFPSKLFSVEKKQFIKKIHLNSSYVIPFKFQRIICKINHKKLWIQWTNLINP